jgi:Uma2 family endonuclease
MQVALTGLPLPVRLRFADPLSEDELFEFCNRNETLRVEQDANGELIVMSPEGLVAAGAYAEIVTDLTIWAR